MHDISPDPARDGGRTDQITKQHGHRLSFAFDGAFDGENFVDQVLGGIGPKAFRLLPQGSTNRRAAAAAEFGLSFIAEPAEPANRAERLPAFRAEEPVVGILACHNEDTASYTALHTDGVQTSLPT